MPRAWRGGTPPGRRMLAARRAALRRGDQLAGALALARDQRAPRPAVGREPSAEAPAEVVLMDPDLRLLHAELLRERADRHRLELAAGVDVVDAVFEPY